jgi:hypothetical protein
MLDRILDIPGRRDGYRYLALAIIAQAIKDLNTAQYQSAMDWLLSGDFQFFADVLGIDASRITNEVFRHQYFKRRQRKSMAKLFKLVRKRDVSGVSGTGIVAEGVTFERGHTVICWTRPPYSVAVFESPEAVLAVHGHDGNTKIEWEEQTT